MNAPLSSFDQDPTGKAKSWNLDRIEIVMEGQSSGNAFVYRDVLKGPDNLSVALEYQVGGYDIKSSTLSRSMLMLLSSYYALNAILVLPQNLYEWEVTLFTSPDSEPFDGSVSLALIDEAKADSAKKLEIVTPDPDAPAGGAPFMPGGKVVCRLKGATVATPTKITLAAVRGWRAAKGVTYTHTRLSSRYHMT